MSRYRFECPKGWEILQPWGDGYALQKGALRAIVDCEVKSDGKEWIHVSVSRKSWTPTHEDMAEAKHAFIGDDRYAYAIWPPSEKYVNIHPHCLHLWACLEGDGRMLPEFSEILPEVGRSI